MLLNFSALIYCALYAICFFFNQLLAEKEKITYRRISQDLIHITFNGMVKKNDSSYW